MKKVISALILIIFIVIPVLHTLLEVEPGQNPTQRRESRIRAAWLIAGLVTCPGWLLLLAFLDEQTVGVWNALVMAGLSSLFFTAAVLWNTLK